MLLVSAYVYQSIRVLCICVHQIQRLPGLPSSNLMSDVLTGRLDSIGFEDILNGELPVQ